MSHRTNLLDGNCVLIYIGNARGTFYQFILTTHATHFSCKISFNYVWAWVFPINNVCHNSCHAIYAKHLGCVNYSTSHNVGAKCANFVLYCFGSGRFYSHASPPISVTVTTVGIITNASKNEAPTNIV